MKFQLFFLTLIVQLLSCYLFPYHKYVTKIRDYTINIDSDEKTDLQKYQTWFSFGAKQF